MKRATKLLASVCLLTYAIGVIASHATGSFFPWLPVSAFIILLLCITISLYGQNPRGALGIVLLASISYRVFIFVDAGSLIAIDPHLYAAWTRDVLLSDAKIEEVIPGFYGQAPLFIIETAMVARIGGIKVSESLIFGPLLLGIFIPLSTYIFVKVLAPRKYALAAAATVAGGALSLRYSLIPISQTMAAVSLLTISCVLVRIVVYRQRRAGVLVGLGLFCLMFSHKLGIYLLMGAACVFATIIIASGLNFWHPSRHSGVRPINNGLIAFHIISLTIVLTYFQANTTGYLQATVFRLVLLEPSIQTAATTSAVASLPVLHPYVFNASTITLFIFGGLAWILLTFDDFSYRRSLLLSLTAASVMAAGLGFIVGSGFRRSVAYSEPFLIALIMVGAFVFIKRVSFSTQSAHAAILILSLLLLVPSVLVTPYATPDHPSYPRYYQTPAETNSAMFVDRVTPDGSTVYTDSLLVQAITPLEDGKFKYWGMSLYNNNLTQERILYRTNMNVFYNPSEESPITYGKPTYDVSVNLSHSHAKVYDSGGGVFYILT